MTLGSAGSILHSVGLRRQKSIQAEVGLAFPVPASLEEVGRAAKVCAPTAPVIPKAARLAAMMVRARLAMRRALIR